MPGTYPRTEQQMLDRVNRNMHRLTSRNAVEHERLNSMEESRLNWRDIGPAEDRPSHNYVLQPRDKGNAITSGIGEKVEKKTESRVVNIPGVGEIDLKDIDNVKMHEVRNNLPVEYRGDSAGLESGKGTSSAYDVIAKMEISRSDNNLPNFEQFSNLPSKRGMSEGELTMEYLQFRTSVANKIEVESRIGLIMDMSSLSDPTGAMGAIGGKFSRQFEGLMAKGLHSSQKNVGFIFVDPRDVGEVDSVDIRTGEKIEMEIGEGEDKRKVGRVEYYRESFGGDDNRTFAAYTPKAGAVGINVQQVTRENLIPVALHDYMHADNAHKRGSLHGREFERHSDEKPGETRYKYSPETISQARACEESVANVRAHMLADDPGAYENFIFGDMYHLPLTPEGVGRFVEDAGKFSNSGEIIDPDRRAEGLTFLKFTKPRLFNEVVPDALRKTNMGDYLKDRIIEISSVCRPFTTNAAKADPSNPEWFKPYEEYTRSKLDISPDDYGAYSEKSEKTFKCSSLCLEEMVRD